ncbi:hypothetical protein M9980_05500 [Sphingomonas donggukensis]|uniref:Uncharacterized protein n=1 Tax=Sphingomonas donggukensis TaxID=2949093 RepID=A0ABY4TYE0_9SPHN|nr:hypothetical protein [Sphingomonas donggukensis]URW76666.1 hypothetical protein M9980_05500 [Sphingomonas donggukensis]
MAQNAAIVAESGQVLPDYAAVADRVLGAPAIIDVTIRDAQRLKPEEAPGLTAGTARFYVTADVLALIRGPSGIAQRLTYLADVPLDARGKAPKLKKSRAIVFARPVAGRAGEVQLTTPDAQRPWTPALDARVRAIAREVLAADAPPAIAGIGNAFHVAGTLPGEGETQIFLNTTDGRPVSLSILRRPGEQTRWAVALSEIVDDAAGVPRRDTLLWYRLACGLPATLPDRALATMAPADAAIAREDYGFVRESLGRCRA